MPVTPEVVRQVIETYVRAWASGDRKLVLSVFAEDCEWHDPVGAPPFRGHAGVARFWDFAHQDPTRKLEPLVQRVIACGNEGILHFVMQVRLPHLNQGLDLTVIDRFVLNEEGKIKLAQAYWDAGCAAVPPGLTLFAPNIDEAYEQ
jgi:steroid delta-isomerase